MKKAGDIRRFFLADEKYLFVGNGPNQLNARFSWDDLLANLCRTTGLVIQRNQKAFPLFFEEISYSLNRNQPVEENIKTLKSYIGQEALKLQPHHLLRELTERNYYKHYLTTNYDYCIEKALAPDFDPLNDRKEKWPKYSLYRFNQIRGRQVWHIHGECQNGFNGKVRDYPESSIMIGFEHYSDYLEKIHHFIKSNDGKGLHDLIQKEIERGQLNWIHLFFIRDIDIIGFGLDYTEAHLWFILNFRARLKRAGVDVPNTIRWIIPTFSRVKETDRIDLLMALEVEVLYVTTQAKDYEEFYRNFINTLR
ncbi:SIR2 family protein [Mucilaginibacter terrae]|uniref:SIR2-like domain-containing protein n=1 Tax=Mucilaginibacter terrae TaxID=1955052 RepID=A0ABU3GNC9_9SPHI|nr:SIR2 family protein [Mucilaginibacter terrae]MDT3401247.1 hypothetical protein [Mucilaginibacter terrae]